MARITFSAPNVGEIDLDDIRCYEDIIRSDPSATFGGEYDGIPVQEDRIRLHLKNGSTKEVSGLSDILTLEGLGLSKCGDE